MTNQSNSVKRYVSPLHPRTLKRKEGITVYLHSRDVLSREPVFGRFFFSKVHKHRV